MIAPVKHVSQPDTVPAWHSEFLSTVLPTVQRHARIQFRRLSDEEREEAIAAAVASALVSYVRLIERGKNPAAFPGRLADFAVRSVRGGRPVGGSSNCRDVLSPAAQRQHGFTVCSLADHSESSEATWKAMLVEDRKTTPAETATVRLDFSAWLQRLNRRKRRIVNALALGHCTNDVAKRFRLSAARISQLRDEFHESWAAFQGEPETALPAVT